MNAKTNPNDESDPGRPACCNPTRYINRAQVRTLLLELARKTRAHRFKRVSESALLRVNARVVGACVEIVHGQPSKGQTIL